jgi:hypothetical protein
MVSIVHLLFITNVAHPAMCSGLDVLGPVEHIHDSIILAMKLDHPKTSKHDMQSDVHMTDVYMCVRQMCII